MTSKLTGDKAKESQAQSCPEPMPEPANAARFYYSVYSQTSPDDGGHQHHILTSRQTAFYFAEAFHAWKSAETTDKPVSVKQALDESSVPSHGAAEIGAEAENTAGGTTYPTNTDASKNCWCPNDSTACKECWPGKQALGRPSADSLALGLRDAAIQYTEQDPPKWTCSGDDKKRFYLVSEVRGMLADFAGHMIAELREQALDKTPPSEGEMKMGNILAADLEDVPVADLELLRDRINTALALADEKEITSEAEAPQKPSADEQMPLVCLHGIPLDYHCAKCKKESRGTNRRIAIRSDWQKKYEACLIEYNKLKEFSQHPGPGPTEPKCAKPGCGDAYGAPSHNPHNWMYHEFVKAEHTEPAPAPQGYCEYSAIHADTPHYFEDQTCVNWKPIGEHPEPTKGGGE